MTRDQAQKINPADLPRCRRQAKGNRTGRCPLPVAIVEIEDGKFVKAKVCKNHLRSAWRPKALDFGGKPCKAFNAAGAPCGQFALNPGQLIDGVHVTGDYCRSHDYLLQPPWDRPRKKRPTPVQFMQELIESNPQVFMLPYLKAAGIDYKIVPGEDGIPDLIAFPSPEGGVRLFGTSKDGDVFVSDHEDMEGMQRAVERIMDRVYGKARQSQEVTIGGKGTETPPVPRSAERAEAVASILMQAGAAPAPTQHEGRRRRGAGKPDESAKANEKANGNGNGHKP